MLKCIWQSTQWSSQRQNSKWLDIQEGNLVLLLHHPEGCNKIQDKCKESEYVMVYRHVEPSVYVIKPVSGKGPVCTVNWCQLQDLKRTLEDKGSRDPYTCHQALQVPSYNLKVSQSKSPLRSHPYATHSKGELPILCLSTTTATGSKGLRKAQSQSNTFCSKCQDKPFWI